MALTEKKIEEEALRLSIKKRAMLAKNLIRSLDKDEEADAEKFWLREVERRYKNYKNGNVNTKSADLVFEEARQKLK